MGIDKAAALVLRSVDYSETSKVVTLYSREYGKLKVLAKGGRRLKSRFEVALDLLSVCSIAVIRKPTAELDLLTEAVLLERFDGLRHDLPALYAAYYVAEVLDGLTQVADPHAPLFDATLEALRRLATQSDRLLALSRFQMLLLLHLGYAPNLESCAGCGASAKVGSRAEYSLSAGGLVCRHCAVHQRDVRVVRGETIEKLRLLGSPDHAASGLAIDQRIRREVWELASTSVAHLLGRRARTLGLLQLDEPAP